jgi:hypothetical protein
VRPKKFQRQLQKQPAEIWLGNAMCSSKILWVGGTRQDKINVDHQFNHADIFIYFPENPNLLYFTVIQLSVVGAITCSLWATY